MSQHIFQQGSIKVVLGYDRPLDYVFCTIQKGGRMLYSNLSDAKAATTQQDVRYFASILAKRHIKVPDEMFVAVEHDQLMGAGNLTVFYDETGPRDLKWATGDSR